MVTTTQYGIQVADAEATGRSGSSDVQTTEYHGVAVPMRTAAPVVAVGAAVLGLAVGL